MPVSVSVRRLYLELLSLSVYRGVLDRPVTAALVRLLESAAGGEEQALCARWGGTVPRAAAKGAAGQPARRRGAGNPGG